MCLLYKKFFRQLILASIAKDLSQYRMHVKLIQVAIKGLLVLIAFTMDQRNATK
jgi:hypothetical protein